MSLHVIKNSKLWFTISGLLFVLSIVGYFTFGLRLGIDFTGGSAIEIEFASGKPIVQADMVTLLKNVETKVNEDVTKQIGTVATATAPGNGNVNAALPVAATTDKEPSTVPTSMVNLGEPLIVPVDNGLTIRTKAMDEYTHQQFKTMLEAKYPGTMEKKFTTIGPTVGDSLRQRAFLSLFVALLGMIIFIAWAFRKVPKKVSPWKFGVTAVVALLHDVFIPVGVFVLLGQLFHIEVESFFVTALLTVMGFSVHDTIVVFDRIRENLMYQKRDESFADVAEKSVQQTMVRSINTSLTAFIMLLFLFLFGSESTKWFVFTMMIGIVIGTYSSIFIATPLLVAWKERGVK